MPTYKLIISFLFLSTVFVMVLALARAAVHMFVTAGGALL